MAKKIFKSEKIDPSFWTKKLKRPNESEISRLYKNRYFPVLKKYLPKSGKILDAGCGWGAWVMFLRSSGYDAYGIDYSHDLVELAKSYEPGIPIKHGNIQKLEYPDGFFKAYISFGVVEHIENGPLQALKEAKRILEKKGILICSVPYFNPLRKTKDYFLKRLKSNYYMSKDNIFYQYLFTKKEIMDYISQADFKLIEVLPVGLLKGIKDEFPFGKKILKILNLLKSESVNKKRRLKKSFEGGETDQNWLIKKIMENFEKQKILNKIMYIISNIAGHMLLFVAKKA